MPPFSRRGEFGNVDIGVASGSGNLENVRAFNGDAHGQAPLPARDQCGAMLRELGGVGLQAVGRGLAGEQHIERAAFRAEVGDLIGEFYVHGLAMAASIRPKSAGLTAAWS